MKAPASATIFGHVERCRVLLHLVDATTEHAASLQDGADRAGSLCGASR